MFEWLQSMVGWSLVLGPHVMVVVLGQLIMAVVLLEESTLVDRKQKVRKQLKTRTKHILQSHSHHDRLLARSQLPKFPTLFKTKIHRWEPSI